MAIKTSTARRCRLTGIAVLGLAALSATGCSSSASSAASNAASQASSAASKAASEAGSLASGAASSASSAASSALAQVKGAVTATGDVTAGPVTIGSDGRAVSTLTVANPTGNAHDYTIAVSFEDPNGKLLDATALNVSNVPANGSATATARSNRTLSGTVTAKVTAAVRH